MNKELKIVDNLIFNEIDFDIDRRESLEQTELIKALISLQSEVTNANLNANNPFFRSKYADLPNVLNLTRPLLCKNGLVISQPSGTTSEYVAVVTTIMHESGQFKESAMRHYYSNMEKFDKNGNVLKPTIQDIGSAITYMRRYSLMPLLGIGQDDDDGNSISQTQTTREQVAKKPLPNNKVDWAVENIQKIIGSGGSLNGAIKRLTGHYQVSDKQLAEIKEKFSESQFN